MPRAKVEPPYVDVPGTHRHRCDKCAFIWSHPSVGFSLKSQHECPGCGEGGQWARYHGPDAPELQQEK